MAANDPKNAQDGLDGIPMSKSNPLVIFGIIGAVVLLLGVVGFKALSSSNDKKTNKAAAAAAAAAQPTDGMTAAERKQHLEITRKSLANWSKDEEGKQAQKKAAEEAAKRKEEEEKARTTAAASPGGGGAPKPAGNPKAAKKAAADLDSIAGDIAGQLAK